MCATYATPVGTVALSTGIWSAASGMVAQGNALDIASENVANASTVGYRADRTIFRQVLTSAQEVNPGSSSMRYAVTRTVQPDLQAGEIRETGNPLDVALTDDSSFLTVRTAEGLRYTRAGKLSVQADGTLITPQGYPVLADNLRPIVIPLQSTATFDDSGRLLIDGVQSDQSLSIVTFPNVHGLIKEGSALMRARPEAGKPIRVDAQLRVGALEMSNSNALQSMSGLVTATRQFEMLARVIDAFSQAERRAATDIASRR